MNSRGTCANSPRGVNRPRVYALLSAGCEYVQLRASGRLRRALQVSDGRKIGCGRRCGEFRFGRADVFGDVQLMYRMNEDVKGYFACFFVDQNADWNLV